MVNFSQGCTTGWHTHTCDQILVVTSGAGMVANEHEQHEINVGDVVHIKAGERHWHGAKADTTMGHITITAVGGQASLGLVPLGRAFEGSTLHRSSVRADAGFGPAAGSREQRPFCAGAGKSSGRSKRPKPRSSFLGHNLRALPGRAATLGALHPRASGARCRNDRRGPGRRRAGCNRRRALQGRACRRRELDISDAFTERLVYEVDPQWAGELPALLFARRVCESNTWCGGFLEIVTGPMRLDQVPWSGSDEFGRRFRGTSSRFLARWRNTALFVAGHVFHDRVMSAG